MSDGEETFEQQPLPADGIGAPEGIDGIVKAADGDGAPAAASTAGGDALEGAADGGVVVQAQAPVEETTETAGSPEDDADDFQPITTEQEAELRNIIEALIFASDEPISTKFLRQIIDDVNKDRVEDNRIRATTEGIKRAVKAINYAYSDRAFHITPIAGGFVFATKAKYSAFVGKLAKEKARRKLSATAIESLAIIAYKQPITKSEVEFIRGVNADYIIKTLLEKNLITITGRASTPGRPLLYGTTDEFLKHFGLNEITDLPKPREIEELIGETELEVEKRMLAEQQELEFKDELAQKMEGGQKPSGSRAPLRQTSSRVPLPAPGGAPPPAGEPTIEPGAGVPTPAEAVIPTDMPESTTAAVEETVTDAVPVEIAAERAGAVEEMIAETAAAHDEEVVAKVTDDQFVETGDVVTEEPTDEAVEEQAPAEVEAAVDEGEERQTIVDDETDERIHPVRVAVTADEETESMAVQTAPIAEEQVPDDAIDTERADDEQPVEPPVLIETLDDTEADTVPDAGPIDVVEEEDAVEEAELAPAADVVEVEEAAEEMAHAPSADIVEDAIVIDEITADQSREPAEEEPVETAAGIPAEAGVIASEAADAEMPMNAGEAGAEPTPEKGWSKWKTKIKTFFKKLFV
jgi:segregation and condensation protein B